MSNARAARRRSQKNKKKAHRVDIHFFFNGDWFGDLVDAEYHLRQIGGMITGHPVLASGGLVFQAHHVQSESKEKAEMFPGNVPVYIAYSEKVSPQARSLVGAVTNGYLDEIIGMAEQEMLDWVDEIKKGTISGLEKTENKKADVSIFFNADWFDYEEDNYHIVLIAGKAASFGHGIQKLSFRAFYVDDEQRKKHGVFGDGEMVGWAFSDKVSSHQEAVIVRVITEHMEEFAKAVMGERMDSTQETPAQESPDHSLSSDSDQH